MALGRTEPPPADPSITPPAALQPANGKPARWGDLRLRVLSAAVLAPLALGCIWIGGAAFTALVALIAIGLAAEWLGLCGQRASPVAIILFAALPVAVMLTAIGKAAAGLLLLAVAAVAAAVFAGGVSMARPLAFGIPYLGLGAVALVWLRQPQASGGVNVIILLLVVWASDIGAYMIGRTFGGPRLAPAISPGKTWSGAAGGLGASAIVGLTAAAFLGFGPLSWRPAVFAALIGVVSQAGDLFESLMKRHFGVKDSGSLIPGHGGLLDRLDALLIAAPVAALLVLILGRGVVLWE